MERTVEHIPQNLIGWDEENRVFLDRRLPMAQDRTDEDNKAIGDFMEEVTGQIFFQLTHDGPDVFFVLSVLKED